jgi:hypothetical protein
MRHQQQQNAGMFFFLLLERDPMRGDSAIDAAPPAAAVTAFSYAPRR